jgi:hypothetical protein
MEEDEESEEENNSNIDLWKPVASKDHKKKWKQEVRTQIENERLAQKSAKTPTRSRRPSTDSIDIKVRIVSNIFTSIYIQRYMSNMAMPCLKQLVAGFPPRQPGFDPRSCGICGGPSGTGAGFLRVLRFPLPILLHRLLHNHHRSSGAGTIGQQWPTYQVDSVSPHPEKLKKNIRSYCLLIKNALD